MVPVSKDLAALGEAGIRMLDYLTPHPATAAGASQKKPGGKSRKAEMTEQKAEQKAEQAAKQNWLAKENAQLARLAHPPRSGTGGGSAPSPSADVRLAAFRPVKVLADALAAR
jgi:hypothetical protein